MDDIRISAQAAQNLRTRADFHAPRYMAPLLEAMAANMISAHLAFRDTTGVQMNADVPNVLIYFDAGEGSTGPSGFCQKLLDDVAKAVVAVIVVVSFGDPKPYADAVSTALKSGGLVVLVESAEPHAAAWLALANAGGEARLWGLWSSPVAGSA